MSNLLEVLTQNIVIDKDKCVYCGKCVDVCIMDNLRLKLAPCREACPLDLNCQGYAQLIARGEEEKALEMIGEKLPFPGILGRICHHPCENKCNRNNVDGSGVALRLLKRYLADNQELTIKDAQPQKELVENIAIIGGGPAGLMAASVLRSNGYQVTIYEASDKLGGMLSSCIPEYRLPEEIVQKETALISKIGVQIFYNTKVGEDISYEEILDNNQAVIITIGIQKSKKLGIEGEDSKNLYNALDFLRKARQKQGLKVGKKVLIIGGGNTAINAAQTAYRLGAEQVRVVCLEGRHEMAAYEWEVSDALEEGILVECGWGPKQLLIQGDQIEGVKFERCCSVFDREGRFAPQFSAGETQVIDADTIIVAIGQEAEPVLNLESVQTEGGFISTNPVTKQTSVAKVFAAGDITIGIKSVADAMAQGREAAISVDRYLRNIPLEFDRDALKSCELDFEVDYSKAEAIPRVCAGKLSRGERTTFKELEEGITKEQAIMEARRCLSCGEPYGKFRTCWSCLPCEVECPQQALYVKIPYLMR